jgi:uncharacterized membrane protein YfcA
MIQPALAILSGGVVGFTLALVGGGGSIMATPLLLYIVGLPPHAAIGTGALASSANALINFAGHAKSGNVRWRTAFIFAAIGTVGAVLGSLLGKRLNGDLLLFLRAVLMIVIGILMLQRSARPDRAGFERPVLVVTAALGAGLLAGFFGIGGGFLIVPGLLLSTGMPMIFAVGTSLLAVASFGFATAGNYAVSGMVDWLVAAEYIVGGIVGGFIGLKLAIRLARRKTALTRIFAGLVFAVALYMLYDYAGAFGIAR